MGARAHARRASADFLFASASPRRVSRQRARAWREFRESKPFISWALVCRASCREAATCHDRSLNIVTPGSEHPDFGRGNSPETSFRTPGSARSHTPRLAGSLRLAAHGVTASALPKRTPSPEAQSANARTRPYDEVTNQRYSAQT